MVKQETMAVSRARDSKVAANVSKKLFQASMQILTPAFLGVYAIKNDYLRNSLSI